MKLNLRVLVFWCGAGLAVVGTLLSASPPAAAETCAESGWSQTDADCSTFCEGYNCANANYGTISGVRRFATANLFANADTCRSRTKTKVTCWNKDELQNVFTSSWSAYSNYGQEVTLQSVSPTCPSGWVAIGAHCKIQSDCLFIIPPGEIPPTQ